MDSEGNIRIGIRDLRLRALQVQGAGSGIEFRFRIERRLMQGGEVELEGFVLPATVDAGILHRLLAGF